ncbi:MaoC/PaaZ C-terminal domain-containing protein [Carboxydothermus pertinax]|uniref:MaoC-like domain-containing protein n=1 Tax=Carboxydothermus pertinax TaxID=870242 RepID=A0A1L8CX62_9THEO|nr:MaoC/PaaZ C-terminal domain-containing protein [Carboxydothermus pertinax]GAV23525.1 hypothetical protein cpu_20350 [Carboxydothermus pertinax]
MKKRVSELKPGDEFPALKKEPVTRVQIARYAGASGDFNPLHLDDAAGIALGTGGVIAHGMLIMGFAGQAVTSWIPKKALKKFGVRFVGMTRPGESITVEGKITEVKVQGEEYSITAKITAKGQNQNLKIKGSFAALLPPDYELILKD